MPKANTTVVCTFTLSLPTGTTRYDISVEGDRWRHHYIEVFHNDVLTSCWQHQDNMHSSLKDAVADVKWRIKCHKKKYKWGLHYTKVNNLAPQDYLALT